MKETELNRDDLLAAGGQSSSPATKEHLAEQADASRQQELALERQLEEAKRQKDELQDLRRKHDEYDQGRKDLLERLTRGLVILEHEEVETQRRLDTVKNAVTSFRSAKEQLTAIRDDQWDFANIPQLQSQLAEALAVVDTARNEFNHYRARLDVLDEKRNPEAAAVTGPIAEVVPGENLLAKLKIGELVKIGFALSLPLLISLLFLGTILLIVLGTRK